MKVKVTLKSPDCLFYAANNIVVYDDNDDEDIEQTEELREEFHNIAIKWFKYGECLTVEIDTEEESIRVLDT